MQKNNCGLVNREQSVLVVIDIQEKLMPVIHDKDEVISNTARLVTFCGIAKIPVVFTEQQKLGATLPSVMGSGGQFRAITKTHFNCFMNPDFSNRIRVAGRNTMILTGVEAHICVAQTALAAVADFNVHVVSDAVSSRSQANKAVALQRMRDAGATITSTEMFIYEILIQAGTDEFKSVLPLVK